MTPSEKRTSEKEIRGIASRRASEFHLTRLSKILDIQTNGAREQVLE